MKADFFVATDGRDSNPGTPDRPFATLSRARDAVRELRKNGTPAAYTIDAGPNVHVLCLQEQAASISEKLKALPGVMNVLTANVGGAAIQV